MRAKTVTGRNRVIPILNRQTIEAARELFSLGEHGREDVLHSKFAGLATELVDRVQVLDHVRLSGPEAERARMLAPAFRYGHFRADEVIARLEKVKWMKGVLLKEWEPGTHLWRRLLGLAIKDFYTDVASLMDSIAPIVIQVEGRLKPQDRERLPGFASIRKGSSNPYRRAIPSDIRTTIDSTEAWWPAVKAVRDILIHRPNETIVFGELEDGILFQIYEESGKPSVSVPPPLLWPNSKDVVNFHLYSAFVTAEVLVFLEQLGAQVAAYLHIGPAGLTKSVRLGNFKSLVSSLDQLAESTGTHY